MVLCPGPGRADDTIQIMVLCSGPGRAAYTHRQNGAPRPALGRAADTLRQNGAPRPALCRAADTLRQNGSPRPVLGRAADTHRQIWFSFALRSAEQPIATDKMAPPGLTPGGADDTLQIMAPSAPVWQSRRHTADHGSVPPGPGQSPEKVASLINPPRP
ncbi:hypothetical protein EDC01DRAFT_628318 [Geopyxis carbonaria]|nr:hypothetical protein EDC01DRAFT_628318 [Geopyxis carbonaria]